MINKIIIALVAAFTIAGSASAYTVTINNRTKKTMRMWVGFYSAVCSDDDFVLKPGASKTIDAGGCCTKGMTASCGDLDAADNPNKLVSFDINRVSTGAGLACRSLTINIAMVNGRVLFALE